MNVKKTIKKIVALGAGAVLVGATILGAVATDLASYPEPFVQDGAFDAKIVVGANAATQDVVGAIDIAASLQAAAKTEIPMDGMETITVEGGELVQKGSDYLSFNQDLDSVVESFDEENFDGLLEDGTLEDDDGDEYDFSQKILLGDQSVAFENPEDDIYDEALFTLKFDENNSMEPLLTFVIDFDDSDVDFGELNDNEKITMFGKEFTFEDIDTTTDEEIVLFGSDETVYISKGETVTVTSEGEDYEITVLGGNSDDSTAILSINGDTETVEAGDSPTIGSLNLYVSDVFISNIGGDEVSVSLFVGSNELILPAAGDNATLEIDGETIDSVFVRTVGTSNAAIDEIRFEIDPTEMENVELDDDYDWLALGDTFVEPLFGFEVVFASVTPSLMGDSDAVFEFSKSGDDLEMHFVDNSGNEVDISLYTQGSTNIEYHEDIATNTTNGNLIVDAGEELVKGDIFFLADEGTGNDPKSRIFEVIKIKEDGADDEVTLLDLLSERQYVVGPGDEIGDTNVEILAVPDDDGFTLDSDTLNVLYGKYDTKITLPDAGATELNITIDEDTNEDYEEDVSGSAYKITLNADSGSDDEVDIVAVVGLTGVTDDDDVERTVSPYGTYFEREDKDDDWVKIYVPMRDRYYNVLVSPGAATITTSSTGTTYDQVNVIGAGMAVLDTEINAGDSNLIVVGGPCANSVAFDLMAPVGACGVDFEQGKGLIKLFETTGDTMAILVAGYDAADTLAATEVIVDYENYASEFAGMTEVEITTSTMAVTEVTVPEVPEVPEGDDNTTV